MRPAAALFAILALAAPLGATPPKKPAPDARASAERFSLDLPADNAEATPPEAPAAPAPAPTPAAPATRFSLDTPIVELLANYQSKAVLDRDMPGLSTDKFLDQFKGMSLNQLAPKSDGRLTPALLEKVGKHLARIE